jgi:hypothetical protein
MRQAAILTGTIVLTALHLIWYTRVVAWWLWELTGGIRHDGIWTAFGTSDWAWTVPVHVPAGLLCSADMGGLGIAALLGGSLAAGFAAACLVVPLWNRERYGVYSWCWRLGFFLASWLWVPVPARVSWIYQWTVVY